MRRLRAWMLRLLSPLTAARRERDLADEIESHLQMHIDDNVRAGMPPAEARRQALLKLGGVEPVKEAYRDRAGFPLAAHLAQDVRFAARLLWKSPGFSTAVVTTVALAVGVNAALFTVLNAAAVRSLPVPGGDRLVTISSAVQGPTPRGVSGMLSYPEFQAVRDDTPALQGAMAFSPFNGATLGTLSRSAEPRAINTTLASCEYFDVLRVRAALGRTFTSRDCERGGTPVVVITGSLWRAAFAADPAIVGRTIAINRSPFVVIGVADAGFTGTQLVVEDTFVPLVFQKQITRDLDLLDTPAMSWLFVIGRLRDDASLNTARAALQVVASRLTTSLPPGNTLRLDAGPATLSGLPEVRTIVLAIGGVIAVAVGLVLLMACANLANLLLARGAARRREMAVRLALGAGRRRLVQQLLTESLLLAAIGGMAGGVAGIWTSAAVTHFILSHLPPGIDQLVFDPRPDWRVALFAFSLTTLTGLAFGLVPALQATRGRLDLRETSATARPSRRRLQSVLVGVQVAISLVLLLSAGLLARGLYRANTLDPGIDLEHILLASYDLRGAGYTPEAAAAFQRQAIDRVRALPGVRVVAAAGGVPLSDQHAETRFTLSGTERSLFMEFSQVSANYFDAIGLPLVRGRTFTPAEIASEQAIVVTESAARALWPGRDPLEQSLILDKVSRPVVGIARDAQVSRLGRTDTPYVFLPAGPDSQASLRLLVAASPSGPSTRLIRDTVASVDPQLAVTVTRLADNLELWRAPSRLFTTMAAALALVALVLASTGVFGTVAYAVSRRAREIGVRVALGASRRDVLRLVVGQGMRPVAIGAAVGLAGGAAGATVLENMLFGLSPHDPLSFALLPAVLVALALLASYLPARRALAVEPTTALRVE